MPSLGRNMMYPKAPDFSKKAFKSDMKKVGSFVKKGIEKVYSSKPIKYERSKLNRAAGKLFK